ncbi:YqeG family HAD IIIA-type phosphatase [Facilibium subflavum]|uniref:YqeG family HAD IIIA-type phosphatase n=1 Tax=Facilibium subflavum TaxID=2219058 RepID=UPI000E64BD98|nr:HAD family hydrolase [Facilibium subflavum]
MGRFFFTIKQSICNSKKLKAIRQKKHQLNNVTTLCRRFLDKHDINYVVLDFDGVLAPHGQPLPDPEITKWLKKFANEFGQKHIFILSNKPTDLRRKYFLQHFPEIQFISDVRKKPYPDGLLNIQKQLQCPSGKIALVDDRLLTGCLACILAGCFPILVTSPFTNYKRRPFQEAFFGLLRFLEKRLFAINGKN